VTLVRQTGAALEDIETRILSINDHIHSIATAAQEQATGLQEVNTAINQMDQVTQRNAAMVEETSAATHKLSGEAATLVSLVGRFRLGNEALQTQRFAAPARPSSAPVASPARKMMGTVARAFSGSAAVAPSKDEWQEF